MSHRQIMLQVNHTGLGIPYYRDDPDSHSYIDLKKSPEQIDLIPEVKDWPELKQAILRINAPESMFNTTGCAAWYFTSEAAPEVTKLTSYLGFCCNEMEFNKDVHTYYGIYHHFTIFLHNRTIPEDLNMVFEIMNTGFNGEPWTIGNSANLFVSGYGSSREDARRLPSLGYSLFADFLLTEVRRQN